ncbi:MAG TPA: maleylpyruvate isomerase family mycothiol-dependent enzyme [Glaciibacter sp.]|nr:maleylpyruvate isomerase family mycothiol-dependent enzyme [Glaciibacter sp.]
MADFAKHLPLSQQARAEEPHVNNDWRMFISTTLTGIAGLLENLSPEQWQTPSLCENRTVRDEACRIVWRLGSSNRERLASGAGAYARNFPGHNRAIDVVSRAVAEAPPADLVARIREIAADKAAGRGRHGVTELTEAVVHGLDIAHPLGLTLAVDPVASGAVAVRRALIAPSSVRGVLRARTLVATDAGWRVGRGPAIPGTAEAHLLFLFGRKPL